MCEECMDGGGCEKPIGCSLSICVRETQERYWRKSSSVATLGRVWLCLLLVFLKLLDLKHKARLPRCWWCFACWAVRLCNNWMNTTCGEINPVSWDPFSSQCLFWDSLALVLGCESTKGSRRWLESVQNKCMQTQQRNAYGQAINVQATQPVSFSSSKFSENKNKKSSSQSSCKPVVPWCSFLLAVLYAHTSFWRRLQPGAMQLEMRNWSAVSVGGLRCPILQHVFNIPKDRERRWSYGSLWLRHRKISILTG